MARVAHALSSARGESHGPAARGAGGSIPHKNPPFRPSGRIPVRDAKRRGRRDARSGREKRGARKKGVRPGTIVKAQVSLPSDLRLRGRARGSSWGIAAIRSCRSAQGASGRLRGAFPLGVRIAVRSTSLTALRGGTSKNRVGNKLGRNGPKSGVRRDADDLREDELPSARRRASG